MIRVDLLLEKLQIEGAEAVHKTQCEYAAAIHNPFLFDTANATLINVLMREEWDKVSDLKQVPQGSFFLIGKPENTDFPHHTDVVIFPEDTDLSALIRITNEIIAEYDRYCIFIEGFRLLCEHTSNMRQIFDYFSGFFHNVVCFGDYGGNILLIGNIRNDYDGYDEGIRFWIRYGYIPYEYAKSHGNIAAENAVENSSEPVFFSEGFASKNPRLTYRTCPINGRYNNYLAVVAAHEKHSYFDREALKASGDILSEQFVLRPSDFNISNIETARNHILRKLITPSSLSDRMSLEKHLQRQHISQHLLNMIVLIKYDISDTDNVPKAENPNTNLTLRRYLLRALNDAKTNSLGIIENDYIILLVQGKTAEELRDKVQRTYQLFEDNAFFLTSEIYSNLFDTSYYYKQVLLLLHLEITSHSQPHRSSFHENYFRVIANALYKEMDLNVFIHQSIRELEKWDQKNNSEYLLTLYEYLQCGQNIGEISRKMNLHRNTVAYRIRKISEIVDIDFDNYQDLCMLYFSYCCLQLNKQIKLQQF